MTFERTASGEWIIHLAELEFWIEHRTNAVELWIDEGVGNWLRLHRGAPGPLRTEDDVREYLDRIDFAAIALEQRL